MQKHEGECCRGETSEETERRGTVFWNVKEEARFGQTLRLERRIALVYNHRRLYLARKGYHSGHEQTEDETSWGQMDSKKHLPLCWELFYASSGVVEHWGRELVLESSSTVWPGIGGSSDGRSYLNFETLRRDEICGWLRPGGAEETRRASEENEESERRNEESEWMQETRGAVRVIVTC